MMQLERRRAQAHVAARLDDAARNVQVNRPLRVARIARRAEPGQVGTQEIQPAARQPQLHASTDVTQHLHALGLRHAHVGNVAGHASAQRLGDAVLTQAQCAAF